MTTTFPHIPEHTPFVSVEWIVQRKRNVPAFRNVRFSTEPEDRSLLNVQLPPNAVTV